MLQLCSARSSTSQDWVYICSTTYVYTRQSRWNPNSKTKEPDWPQYDHPATSIITQQHSSATFISLQFHSKPPPPPQINWSTFQKCYFLPLKKFHKPEIAWVSTIIISFWSLATMSQYHHKYIFFAYYSWIIKTCGITDTAVFISEYSFCEYG